MFVSRTMLSFLTPHLLLDLHRIALERDLPDELAKAIALLALTTFGGHALENVGQSALGAIAFEDLYHDRDACVCCSNVADGDREHLAQNWK